MEMTDVNSGTQGFIYDRSAALVADSGIALPNGKPDLRVKRVELVVRCQELARFLHGFDERSWAGWVEDCVNDIREDSVSGAERLLAGYNGIGSLSDVYLCPEAGHKLRAEDEVAINEQFLLMLSKVNNLAHEICSY